jgi:prophage antirepressor-like protein
MTNAITPFIFEKVEIRNVIGDDGKPWFVAVDIADALGYENTRKAVQDHCKNAQPIGSVTNRSASLKLHPQTLLISRNDVTRLVARSNLPSAERFQDWLFDEVIPAILDTGHYGVAPVAIPNTKELALLAIAEYERAEAEKARADALAIEVVEVTAERDAKSHSVDLANTVYAIISPSAESIVLEDVQKLFGIPYKQFFRNIRTLKIIQKNPHKIVPMEYYTRADQKGKWFECTYIDGYQSTRVLPLGVVGIAILFIEAGLLMLELKGFIERMEETIRTIDVRPLNENERKHIEKAKRQLDKIKAAASQPMFPGMGIN